MFVGGLFDNLLTVPFAHDVARNLPEGWRFMQATLSSSGIGWGTSNLDKDVEELGRLVGYLRNIRPQGKVVLLGHSTGSQDTLHYLSSASNEGSRPRLDGAILQAPASDREGLGDVISAEQLKSSVKLAQEMISDGRGQDLLPRNAIDGMPPLTADRWLSLASPGPDNAGQDDMFSSDLSDERLKMTFGRVGQSHSPLMILFMGEDQYVPKSINKEALVQRWIDIVKENGGKVFDQSGVVPGMDHAGAGAREDAKLDLAQRVAAFVNSL